MAKNRKGFLGMKDADGNLDSSGIGRVVVVLVLVLVVVVGAVGAFFTVPEGYQGVLYQFGKVVQDDIAPGLGVKIPFVQTVVPVDTREQVYEVGLPAYTKDTQSVENLRVKLNYRYDQANLSNIIRNIGIAEVENKLIVPQVMSVCKNEVGQYRAEELIAYRSVIQNAIQETLTRNLGGDGIIVSAFAIEDIDFENGFEEAVRAKVVAEQQALQMQNKTKEQEELAKQRRIAAEAEAYAIRTKSEADAYAIELIQVELQAAPQYIDYIKANSWDGKLPTVIGNEINPFVILDGESAAVVPQSTTAAPQAATTNP